MNLEQHFESLTALLNKMYEQYKHYKDALLRQRAAIIENNTAELTEILTEIDDVNENINRLETRREYAAQILFANAKNATTIRDLVIAFPQFNGQTLEKISLELKKELLEVKRLADSNGELLEISRNIVRETMNTIMSQNIDPRDRAWRTYGNGGTYSRTVRREPVHLVNKRG
ncbi:hypothetical protein AGMMS49938_12470 [Fibrobacterales bacterium]|nr:hypothetical protein AGMMS49938_12470 [Fibrobacterales bacterium]